MNVNVQINTNQNETLMKTASDMAAAILTAIGGDSELDTVTVSVSATAGSMTVAPAGFPAGVPTEPPAPRSIG
jgi:hypothetical protein